MNTKLPNLEVLPISIVSLASIAIPLDSSLFREALHSADNLDKIEVALYEDDPPYAPMKSPSNTPSVMKFMERMTEVMSGRMLWQQ